MPARAARSMPRSPHSGAARRRLGAAVSFRASARVSLARRPARCRCP
jgi:hypothetical protein